MPTLTVHVCGSGSNDRMLALPFQVFTPDAMLIGEGMASPGDPHTLELPAEAASAGRVYVRAMLPDGRYVQERADLVNDTCIVDLGVCRESPHEWLEWATPFRSLSHLKSERARSTAVDMPPIPIGRVWMTLWTLQGGGQWAAETVPVSDRLSDRQAQVQQIQIDVPHTATLLQIGGDEVAWRLISLPPGGLVKVALTPSGNDQGDPLEITIGRQRTENELIMSYLSRGALAEADKLMQAWHAADLLMYRKRDDPVGAAAAAYFLLRAKGFRKAWVHKLIDWFPYLADGAIVSAAAALQRPDADEREVRDMIQIAASRGLPVFAMGASLLVETMAAVHRGAHETRRFHSAYLAAQAYERASCSDGAYFAFYGKSPAQPSLTPIYGQADKAIGGRLSQGPAEPVYFARPRGAAGSARFGNTTVSLPRAPVSAELLAELTASDQDRTNEQGGARGSSLYRTVVLGVPAFETRALGDLAVPGLFEMQAASAPPQRRPKYEGMPKSATKTLRRQTAKFWHDEREKHAAMLFDGDDS